ncbi:beta-lactamase family protein [candidate division KSB1 bacterium]|nr:beta-lactamase family protein [candidate division KSB1 bacterium]
MKNLFYYFLLISVLMGFFSGIQAQDLEKKSAEIDQVMHLLVKLDQFSGCIMVAREGRPFYARAFGEADKDFHIKNDLTTKFNIGSIGKTFTATAIMQLAQQGKLKVGDPVNKYLKDFPYSTNITIHHLLTHTAGIDNYFLHPDFKTRKYEIRGVQDTLPLIYDQKLLNPTPGEHFSYSNSGIVILGAVIEAITGQNYADYIDKNIFRPLGMFDTCINYPDEIVENRASGYERGSAGYYKRNIYTVPPANADGGIETTVADLLRFDQALYTEKLLDEKYKKLMFTSYKENYGYCWYIREKYGQTMMGHSGGAPGVSADFRRFVDDYYTIIVLSNYSDAALPVSKMIEAILFDREYEFPKPASDEFFSTHITKKNLADLLSRVDLQGRGNGYNCRLCRILNFYGYDF